MLLTEQQSAMDYWRRCAYAWEKLQAASEGMALRDAHRDWCVKLAEQAEPMLYRSEQLVWLERLENEHENLRSALAFDDGGLVAARIAAALAWFWYLRGSSR